MDFSREEEGEEKRYMKEHYGDGNTFKTAQHGTQNQTPLEEEKTFYPFSTGEEKAKGNTILRDKGKIGSLSLYNFV